MRLRVNPKRTAKALTTNTGGKKRGRGRPPLNKPAESIKNLFGNKSKGQNKVSGKASGNKPKVTETSSEKPGITKVEIKKEKEEPVVQDTKVEVKKVPEPPPIPKEPSEPTSSKATVSNSTPAEEKKEKPPPKAPAKSPGVTLRGASQAKTPVTPKPTEKVPETTVTIPSDTAVVTEKEKEKSAEDSVANKSSKINKTNKDEEEGKQAARTEPTVLGEEKQLVIKLDKLATQEIPPPKRSERAAVVQKRKLSEESPRSAVGKRGRPPSKPKVQTQEEPEPKEKEKTTQEKDERSFERFYAKVKEESVVSERWSFGGVLWDPTKKMKVMAASEVDVTSNGNMRLRRCVQVFENMTVRVMVEGADMSSTFTTTGTVKNANEVSQLIHKVATSKICSGIKNFGATDKVYFPHCVLRGESYFAPECPIVIDYGVVGPLCQHCNRLRNMIHRRNVKETNLLYSKFSRAPVKNIRSGFGKQLYSMLTDMIEASSVDAKKERKKLRRMIPANAKEYPFRSDTKSGEGLEENQHILQQQQQQLQLQLAHQLQLQQQQQHQQLQQYIKSDSAGNITISSIPNNTIVTPSTVNSEFIRLAKPFFGQSSNSEMMTFNVVSGQRGSYKVSREGGQLTTSGGNFAGTVLTPGEMQMVEQLVLQEGHDVGNVIIQNSGDFTLAEGQEYELIGEADPNNPIQVLEVLKEENESNNTIEIIEVDDQTLAQLTSQNLSNFIIQEPNSDFEVQEIDADDPNFRHLVKALNPGTVVYQS